MAVPFQSAPSMATPPVYAAGMEGADAVPVTLAALDLDVVPVVFATSDVDLVVVFVLEGRMTAVEAYGKGVVMMGLVIG